MVQWRACGKHHGGDEAEPDRGVLIESRGADAREPSGHETLQPDEPRRGQSDADVRVGKRQGAEFREEQRIAQHLRDGVGAEEGRDQRSHEHEQPPLVRLESEPAGEALEEERWSGGHGQGAAQVLGALRARSGDLPLSQCRGRM